MGVARHDVGQNINADVWGPATNVSNLKVGDIPNGTINFAGNCQNPPNSGRVLLIFYTAEPGGAASWSPTITVGGQSPDYTYTNIHDLGNDVVTGLWIWMEDTIQAMSGATVSTGGTWPSTTSEGWAYCVYRNVDQTIEPTVNYQEDASTTSIDIDTTSDSDDVIIACVGHDNSGVGISTSDTLDAHVDENCTDCRLIVAEGIGGDNTTTLTTGSSVNWASYAIRLKYKKYAITWHWKEDSANRTDTTAGFTNPDSAGEIPSNVMMAGRQYLLITKALINQNSTSTNVLDCRMNREGGSQVGVSGNDNRESRRSASTYGQQYFYLDTHTIATVAGGWYGGDGYDYQYQHRTDGVQQAYCKHLITSMIDLSDLDAGDYYYVDDTTGYTALDNTGWTDTASQTLGDGSSDWVFFYAIKVTVDSTSASIRVRLTIDDVVVGNQYLEFEGEDSGENWWVGGMATADAVAASSSVVVECQTDSATAGLMDVQYARLFALRLNQFEDHFTDYDAAGATISVVDTDTLIDSVAHTTDTVANADWMIGYFGRGDDHGENTKTIGVDLRDGTTTGDRMASNTDRNICGNGANDRYPLGPLWAPDENLADATSKTYRVYGNEEVDVTPAVGIDEQWMFGFSTVFAVEAAGGEQAGSLATLGVGY